jgi:NADH-quinone oxidoreductase subunit L
MYAVQRQPEKPVPILEKKFYFDEVYDALFYRPAVWFATALERWVDRPLVAGTTTGVGQATRELGSKTRRIQTGFVRSYVLLLAAGLAALAVVFIAVR